MSQNLRTQLYFPGSCEQALSFYQHAVGAELLMQMRYCESPKPLPPEMTPERFKDFILHASLMIGDTCLHVADSPDESLAFQGFRLALTSESETDVRGWFDALAEEGDVEMSLTQTFWSPLYGLVTDKFGVGWQVMVAQR